MSCETAAIATDDTPALLDALRRGDFASAEQTLAAAPLATGRLQTLAEGLMRRRRWADAAWLFSQIQPRDNATEMKRTLSRNLAAMQTARPEIYRQLIALPPTADFGIAAAAGGKPTILARRADGSAVSLSGGTDPLAAAAAVHAQVGRAAPNGESVAACGIGDGYLLQLFAQRPPALFMDMEQAVFVFEPDPQVLLHVLMIHDFAGPGGPIEAERFRWFVGLDWAGQLDRAVEAEPTIGLPGVTLQQGLGGSAIQAHLQAGIKTFADRDALTRRDIEDHYATRTPADLAEILGENPPRPPRVMLLTTRFSTVLQHSTRDTAEAFGELGWDARVVIEPGPSHRLFQHAIGLALAEFQPDVMFQIDHLRYEHNGIFPPNLPFVCWVQDHLAHLKTPQAAAAVAQNDFVLTDAGPVYAATFGYPLRQIIGLNKLTRVSAAPRPVEAHGDDLVFVSNASYVADEILSARAVEYDGSAEGGSLLARAGARLIDVYRTGGCVSTWVELLALVESVRADLSLDVAAAELESVAAWLFHPLNDALYRQQALGWAADAAAELGLSLALYGKGWERHPRFAPHARGPVAYGTDLERLTRGSRFNLQVVPYLCLHQRLLDGLSAGGFYLIRRHPADTEVGALLKFLDAGEGLRGGNEFERRVAACRPALVTSDADDAVAIARHWQEMCLVDRDYSVLPSYADASFTDFASLRGCLAKFVADPSARDDVRERQRASVIERFSYSAGMGRVLARVGCLLAENAEGRGVRTTGRAAA